jgi:S-formylglutathione hydrolase
MSAKHQHLLAVLISAAKQKVIVMKSHATAATLLGAALLSAATAVAQSTTPRAVNGTLIEATVPTTNVPGPVPITYYLPKHYDAKRPEPYPLIIQLHGGNGSNKVMENLVTGGEGMGRLLDQAIENGLVAPMVSVMPSAGRSFYMNFRDGSEKWEDFVMKDLLPYMRKNFNVVQGREGTFITGISMGGMGSLRMAVKYPEVFQAVASQEPGIEPALAYDDITLRNKIIRP